MLKNGSYTHITTFSESHIWKTYRVGFYYVPFIYHECCSQPEDVLDGFFFLGILTFSNTLFAVIHHSMNPLTLEKSRLYVKQLWKVGGKKKRRQERFKFIFSIHASGRYYYILGRKEVATRRACQLPIASITKYHEHHGFNNTDLLSSGPGSHKSKMGLTV